MHSAEFSSCLVVVSGCVLLGDSWEMAGLETLQDLVTDKLDLLNVQELGQCCVQLNVAVPIGKKGKKMGLKSLILNHLTSTEVEDEDDGGEAVFKGLHDLIEGMSKPDMTALRVQSLTQQNAGGNDNSNENGGNFSGGGGKSQAAVTKFDITRIREFKVQNGTFSSEEMSLESYKSLCYQMDEARDLGYKSKEIVSGVIKGMTQPLKGYFQGKSGWTEASMMETIRSLSHVKESTQLLEEMMASSQEANQTEMNFLIKMMGRRDTILTLTSREKCPLGEALVRERFAHAVAVGLKKDTIRIQFQSTLKDSTKGDHELMEELRLLVERDSENRSKTKRGRSVDSNNLNVDLDNQGKEKKGDRDLAIVTELQQLRAEVKQFNALQKDVAELKKKVTFAGRGGAGGRSNGGGNGDGYRFIKCQACTESRAYCTHCSICGDGGHKRRDCTREGNE